MGARAWILGMATLVAFVPLACSDGALTLWSVPEPDADAGAPGDVLAPADASADAGVPVVVRSTTPATSVTPGARVSATWAAYRTDAGEWRPLAASATGQYTFIAAGARWAIALVCADTRSSLVAIYERPVTVTELEAVLEPQCGPLPSPSWILDGTFTHVPAGTGWLDFGYALDARGAVLIPSGDSAPYEIVNVVDGTWDLAFGLRDEAAKALTKIAVVRGRALNADTSIDVDLDVVGVVPGTRKLVVSGVAADETVTAPVAYAMNEGLHGIDVGPQETASGASVELVYATLPASAQHPGDRYRPRVVATGAGGASARGVSAAFHDPIDVAIVLPAALPELAISVVASAPYARTATRLETRARASSYEIVASVRMGQRSRRAWSTSIDASLATEPILEVVMPDLSSVPGFDASWVLPADRDRTITATVHEPATPLGDGVAESFASRSLTLPP